MARSNFITQLPLDDWFKIMGANPLHANQLFSNTIFLNNQCGTVWFSESFQHSDRIGRDDLAMAIQAAEMEIEQELGYHLTPQWTVAERLSFPRPAIPEMYGSGVNVRGMLKSVEAARGHLISGGIRTKTLIQSAIAVVRSDQDGDGYAETCTVLIPTTLTDINEFHLYYPTKAGADGWEIRPIQVAISGGFVTINFKSWQIVSAQAQEQLDPQPLDADDPASYELTVDCYRIYNDPSTQVQFLWEDLGGGCGTCAACQLGTQSGCFHLRDARLGILVPAPASWNVSTQSFTPTEYSTCREPDQIRLWYYSGFRDETLARPYVEMSMYWRYAVAYYAASKIDRPVCGCSNFAEYVEKFRGDMMYSSMDKGGFQVTPEFQANRLGTSVGAFYAYRRIHQNGVRIIK